MWHSLYVTRTFKPRLHDTICCQTGLTTGYMFVYTIQPVVKPVWQPVVSCIQTFYRLSNPFDNWLYRVYSRFSNRCDNRLYCVNGVLQFFTSIQRRTPSHSGSWPICCKPRWTLSATNLQRLDSVDNACSFLFAAAKRQKNQLSWDNLDFQTEVPLFLEIPRLRGNTV